MLSFLLKFTLSRLLISMVITGVISSALLASYIVIPQYKEFLSSKNVNTVLNKLLNNQSPLTSQPEDQADAVKTSKQKLFSYISITPANQLESNIIVQLQKISLENNVELNEIKPGNKQMVNGFEETSFNISLSGSYHDIYSWISSLNDELGFTSIKQLKMSHMQTSKTSSHLQTKLLLASYVEVKK